MASGIITDISSDEEYKRKVQQSIEPVVVIYFSSLDDRCKAMEPVFEEVNNDIQAVKFYRIDVDKHIMLSRAYNDKILPKAVLVKNGADSLILRGDVSHQEIRKGLQAILDSSV